MSLTESAAFADRLLLFAVFLFAGAAKFADAPGFRKTLGEFGLPSLLANPVAVLLPAMEIAVAAALLASALAWYAAWGTLAFLFVFVAAIGVAMLRGRKPDCHCFGQIHSSPVGRATLIRNGLLAAGAGWLIYRGPLRIGPDVWTWLASLNDHERKIVLVGICVGGFLFFRLLDRSRPRPVPVEPEIEEEEEEPAPAPMPVRAVRPAPIRRPIPPPEPAPPTKNVLGIGLPVGTPAPEFELHGLDGQRHSLTSLRSRGKDILLVFSSPFCEPCASLAGNLMRWMREMEEVPEVILISRGTPQQNVAKLKGFDSSRVLLQRESEVSVEYDCISTPTGVLVGADGCIKSLLSLGGVEIRKLLVSAAKADTQAAGNRPE